VIDVGQLLDVTARRYPQRTAVVDERRSLTYAEYRWRANRVANAIAAHGVRPGDAVAVLMGNSVSYAEVIFGLARAGAVAAHVSHRLSPAEMAALIEDSGACTLIFDAEYGDMVAALLDVGAWAPELAPIVADEGAAAQPVDGLDYEAWLAGASERTPDAATEPIFYLGYTSGTTGRPKGARIPQATRVLTAIAACTEYGLGADDVTLMFTPMHHGGPLVFVLAPVVTGGRMVIMRRFDPDQAWRVIAEHGVTNAFVVPTILGRLIAARGDSAPTTLRVLVSNAAPLPTAVKEATLRAIPGVRLHEFYGSTEAGIVTTLRPEDQFRKRRCAGQPLLLTEVEIRDDQGRPVGAGEVGELFSRSPYLFDGYHGRAEATAEAMVDGWVTAGDLARTDDEGYVYIVGRKKDMIISGGVNIYPQEIEDALLAHPAIAEAAVIGVPDDDWGERVKAAVVLADGAHDASAAVAEATRELGSYKRPRSVDVHEALPRNAAGKVLKHVLRSPEWAGREAEI
jgi:long-chain acyl-CoA synthetase